MIEVHFDEFRAADGLSGFVLEFGELAAGFNVEDFGGVAVGVLPIEAEIHSAVAAGVEGDAG